MFFPVAINMAPLNLVMARHNDTGRSGEELALQFLVGKGYSILHRNWRHGKLEVDLIAQNKGILHFIEVKTRRTRKYGKPEENVDRKKIRNLMEAAEEYLYQDRQWKRIRFDVLAITMVKDEAVEYFWIEDVYL